jgi:chromosome partitioning protein
MMTALEDMAKRGWKGKLLGILPTFYDESTTESKETMQELQQTFEEAILPPIHRATLLREAPAEGKLVYELDPQHRATREYHALSEFVIRYS